MDGAGVGVGILQREGCGRLSSELQTFLLIQGI